MSRFLPDDPVKRGRVQLALLLAVFAIPLVAAWVAYMSGALSGGQANYGTLLPPRLIEGLL